MTKIYNDEDVFASSEAIESKLPLRTDNELFNEEDSKKIHSVVSIKRNIKHGEDWEILVDGKITLAMKGTRFTNSEKDFLRTVEGMRFLILEYKNGKRSVVKIKEELRKRFL